MRFPALVFAATLALAFVPAAHAEPLSAAPCNGANEHVHRDVSDTLDDPAQPECGSLTDPCWADGGRCGGCGPPVLEWVVGPIYCP